LLTRFGDKHTYSGGYQARKEIHLCSPYSKFSANSSFTTLDLGPTRLDFNLGTPRSKIPSHFPQSTTSLVIIRLQLNLVKLPSKTNYLRASQLWSSNNLQLNKTVLSLHQGDTRKAHN